ncbi:hypothetical protein Leryth_013709 [Lithospermum erythrorhizon]|uniref:GTPase-activating protein n=1 Tax=Lithospermum erythrorhizon TaxID=34254 RepID=A0AAV3NTK7_LITER|nr:hypothetical protein Leryth_013709 [Lithospermum erythrorhizon]
MEPPMEQPSLVGHSQRRQENEPEFNLKEWSLKARISRESTRGSSRRYSASFIGTFREDEEAAKSFRSNFTISSTASSPGYTIRGDIDPSTYSFTTAIKALKAKNIYSWEQMSPDGRLPLNSKWSEAERYICNPLSGEVPLECLSAKTLSGRSFHHYSNRITMPAPFVQPLPPRHLQRKPPIATHENELKFPIQEEKIESMTRDDGIQSSPVNTDSSDNSPITPSIEERTIKHSGVESEDSLVSSEIIKFDAEIKQQVEIEELNEEEQEGKEQNEEDNDQNGSKEMISSGKQSAGGCFVAWKTLWIKRSHEHENVHKTRKKYVFLCHRNGCLKE